MSESSKRKREELRRIRLEAEGKARSGERRQTMVKTMAATALVSLLAMAGLFVAMTSGKQEAEPSKSAAEINRLFAGIPQDGTILGDPKASLTIVEFGDLACSHCKVFADEVVPEIVNGPVREGKASFEFRNLPTVDSDSTTAAKASLAASVQSRYLQYIEAFYAEQGTAGSGYITDEFLRDIAEKAGVPDLDKWEEDRNDPRWVSQLGRNADIATSVGIEGTPRVALEDSEGNLTPLDDSTPEAIEAAIDAALSADGR